MASSQRDGDGKHSALKTVLGTVLSGRRPAACTLPPKHLRACSIHSNACQEPRKAPSLLHLVLLCRCTASDTTCSTQSGQRPQASCSPVGPALLSDAPSYVVPINDAAICTARCSMTCKLRNLGKSRGELQAACWLQHRLTSKDGSPSIECYAQCLPVVKVLLYHLWKPL